MQGYRNALVRWDLIHIRAPKFVRGDGEDHSIHKIGALSGESNDRVMRLSAGRNYCRVFDPHHGLYESGQGIGSSFKSPAERSELNGLKLQCSVGKQKLGWRCGSWHGNR